MRFFYTWNLPKNTPRIKLADGSIVISRNPISPPIPTKLPPLLKQRHLPNAPMLTSDQITKLRELRSSDPDSWTVSKLAKEFNTTPGIIMTLAKCPIERKERIEKQLEQEFNDSSIHRKLKIIDRIRRKELW